MARTNSLPRLPQLVDRKIYKTGQTRGADDDQVFQNRVGRNSTVLIPLAHYDACRTPADGTDAYENGFIVLVEPEWYFSSAGGPAGLSQYGLKLGRDALIFYQRRRDWDSHNPESVGWTPANSRRAPLGGEYVARVAGTTSSDGGERINRGFTTTKMKGAGIRVYEYASSATIAACRVQLEAQLWRCEGAIEVMAQTGMTSSDAMLRKAAVLAKAEDAGLLDESRLQAVRIVDAEGRTVCPLCLDLVSAGGFSSRMQQAEGREVYDLTVTDNSLFHIEELRVGSLGHRPYNLGWGHHHCNVVTKDAGIHNTLEWMKDVLKRNSASGYKL